MEKAKMVSNDVFICVWHHFFKNFFWSCKNDKYDITIYS